MSWGFLAVNQNNQVLVSSDTRNLHFVGKATLQETVKSVNSYGGIRQWKFRINSAVTPMPFFTMPSEDYYGVSAIRNVSTGVWEIEVIRSGTTDSIPEVYVFADPRAVTPTDTKYGMAVYLADGTRAFDSRLRPLVVSGGISVAPPSNPRTAVIPELNAKNCKADANTALAPDNQNTYTLTGGGGKPIYFFPTLAQAEREAQFSTTERDCTGFDAYGTCIGYGAKKTWKSTYWAFYRGGIKRVGTYLYCGWIVVEYGCRWTYQEDDSFLGIGIGGDSGKGGTWPYSNETLNLAPVAVITADGSKYD